MTDCAVGIYNFIEDGKDQRIEKELAKATGFISAGQQASYFKGYIKFVKTYEFFMYAVEDAKSAKNKSALVRQISKEIGVSEQTGWTYARYLNDLGIEFFPHYKVIDD